MADNDDKKPAKKADKPAKGDAPKGGAPKSSAPKGEPKADKGKAPKAKGESAKAADGGDGEARAPEQRVTPRLRTTFDQTVRQKLSEQFGYKNPMQVPMVTKVVLNMGIGEAVADRKKVESAAADLSLIAGQRAVITKSRKAISTYKLRENQPIGCKVTLRKARMYEFIDRLVNIALPRVRDFRGLNPKSFDGRGNYALGLKEHIIFPEIDYDKAEAVWGMDIVICTNARNDEEARALLTHLNFPFRQ